MNYSHKDVENNFIKYDIHYCNDTLSPKCETQTPPNHIKANTTQTSNFNTKKIPKLNLYSNSFINQNKDEINKENVKYTLQLQNEYSKTNKRRFFISFKQNNKSIIVKGINTSKYDDIILKRYISSL